MTRYRALSFGQPLAPWQATYELAAQSAIETGGAHREPSSGRVYLSPGVEIEAADGEVLMTPEMDWWAEALYVVFLERENAVALVDERIEALADDRLAQARWRMIRSRIVQIMESAAKDAGQ